VPPGRIPKVFMHIGILQTGHAPDAIRPETGDYSDFFERLLDGHGFGFTTWNVVDMEFPPGPGAAEGWLITGSRHGAYEDLPWIPPLEALIREIETAAIPLVGICFGHQIVAQALGGKVEKFKGGWVVGRQVYDWDGTATSDGAGTEDGTATADGAGTEDGMETRDRSAIALNAWHQDQVTTAPDGARTLASNGACAHAALLYGDRMYTVQPHPEYDADFIEALMTHRGAAIPRDRLDAARQGLGAPTDRARIAGSLARFLKERRP